MDTWNIMYALEFLAPLIIVSCLEGLTTKQGDVCVLDTPKSSVVYYEKGKSCYVNGTFYRKCEEANGSI